MTSISYLQAASCLPIIGPVFSLYSCWNVLNKISPTKQESISYKTDWRIYDLINAEISNELPNNYYYCREIISPQLVAKANQNMQDMISLRAKLPNKYRPANEKSRIDAICALVGNILTLALTVGLVALGIITITQATVTTAYVAALALLPIAVLYQTTKNMKMFQRLLEPPLSIL